MKRWQNWLLASCVLTLLVGQRLPAAENTAAAARLLSDVEYLASDKLEGRGIGTTGIFRAAEHISQRFRELGLKPPTKDGGYLQRFSVAEGWKSDLQKTSLTLIAPNGEEISLELGKNYQPLVYGDEGAFDAPIVFVGYGITDEKIGYDDYAAVDVTDKVVLMMRREPQQDKADSPFDGLDVTNHSAIHSKIQNAWVHKAKAVLMVTDPFTVAKENKDTLEEADYIPNKGAATMPLAQITQDVANRLLAGTTLGDLSAAEKAIDNGLKPQSMPLEGWKAKGEYRFERISAEAANVVGVLEGEGPHADETIVIGAHYDHLGFGGQGSLAKVSNVIHNGADDNASGTAVLMELARRFAQAEKKPPRRLVFIAFSAEERGLLGSRHYVKDEPLFPLDKTIAMVNFDMVGRMNEKQLTVFGVKTGKGIEELVDQAGAGYEMDLKKVDLGAPNSDHATFYNAEIPALHLFTGVHSDYHRPSDDTDKINTEGMALITDFSEDLITALLNVSEPPAYVKLKSNDPHAGLNLPASKGATPYLGTIPDYAAEEEGAKLQDVIDDGPAAKAGLKAGDLIVELAGTPVKNVETYAQALYTQKPGSKIKIAVLRDGERKEFTVELGSKVPSGK